MWIVPIASIYFSLYPLHRQSPLIFAATVLVQAITSSSLDYSHYSFPPKYFLHRSFTEIFLRQILDHGLSLLKILPAPVVTLKIGSKLLSLK